MEPLSLLASSVLFMGARLARKPADEFVDQVWKRIKEGVWGSSDRALAPTEVTEAVLERAVRERPHIRHDLEAVFGHFSALRRARIAGEVLNGARVLWIDDYPENNIWERRMLEELGVACITAETTRSAAALLEAEPIDLIISDIARSGNTREGIEALPTIRAVAPTVPLVFYIGFLSSTVPPVGAQGIADEPNELLHLVLDQLERSRV